MIIVIEICIIFIIIIVDDIYIKIYIVRARVIRTYYYNNIVLPNNDNMARINKARQYSPLAEDDRSSLVSTDYYLEHIIDSNKAKNRIVFYPETYKVVLHNITSTVCFQMIHFPSERVVKYIFLALFTKI